MPLPVSNLIFSNSRPAAPAGMQNAQWQEDFSAAPIGFFSANVPNTGGTAVQTANYGAQASDCGKLLVFNSPSAVTLTLPPSIPFEKWQISIANIGSGALSVTPRSLNLDGSASAVPLGQLQSMTVLTDGIGYFSSRGLGGLSNPMTTEGDLIVGGASGVPTRLTAGAVGYVLTSNGAAAAPSWQPGGGSGGGVPIAISAQPDWPPSSPTSYDDEFTDATLNPRWSWINQGSASANLASSFLGLISPSAGSGDDWHLISQAVPAPPWEFTLAWLWNGNLQTNFLYGGLIVYDSTTGKFVSFHQDNNNLQVSYWNSATSFNANQLQISWLNAGKAYMKIRDDGTNLIFSYSRDGANFWQALSVGRTAFLAFPDHICIGSGTNISAGNEMILSGDWFRRTQ